MIKLWVPQIGEGFGPQETILDLQCNCSIATKFGKIICPDQERFTGVKPTLP